MRILNIMQGTNTGGTEKSSFALMTQIKEFGNEFFVLSLSEMGGLSHYLDEVGICYKGFSYQGRWGWKSFFKYRRQIKMSSADAIMMTGHSLIGMLAIGLRLRQKSCLFIHFHHTGVKRKWQWKLIYLIADKIFEKIYFASDFILQEALEIYPRISAKSFYLPNPLPSKKLIPDIERRKYRKKFKFEDNDIVIGNAGWLIKRKRFDIFLTTCARLKEKNHNIKILIAGEGEEKESLLTLSKKLGIEDDITWLGWVDDLTSFHNSIDFMLFNSDWDSVGLSPLEAIQLGIPTFSSVVNGGLKEILTDNFSIFLQDNHEIEELANKIHYAIENKNEIMDLTLKCRDHINQLSDPNIIAKKVLNSLTN